MFIGAGMLIVPSGQTATYTTDQRNAAAEVYRIATTTTREQRGTDGPVRERIKVLQRRIGLSPVDGLIGRGTAKAVAVIHGRPIPGIDISSVTMPTLNPDPGATAPVPATAPAPVAEGGSAPASQRTAAQTAAQDLYDYVMSTPRERRDEQRVRNLQTAIGVEADGRVGYQTGSRVFALIGRRIPGTERPLSQSAPSPTRTIVRAPSSPEQPMGDLSLLSGAQGSLVGQDDIGSFFERNKTAIIATSAVLVAGGLVALYFGTRED